jgi:GT2 family glycosyltransferase
MSRPSVSVVMPFAGDPAAAREAVQGLLELSTQPGDEFIVADNSGVLGDDERVTVVRAQAEQSPAHARNVGAARAGNEWILFLDADCRAPAGLLDAYFATLPEADVGALAGEVVATGDHQSVAARYGASRNFLGQAAHLSHPYLPRAVAANLLVRRVAFEQVGGFHEGLRAAEDTDFSWRLQRAGWRLELRTQAAVEHRYRTTVRHLRAQWRGYAAGRAWLRRRYPDFTPQPAARRAVARGLSRERPDRAAPGRRGADARASRVQRAQHTALDAMLGVEELAGFAMSNRPRLGRAARSAANIVLVADRFPARGDPLADYASTLRGARVEASGRPDAPWLDVARELDIAYREDDGAAARLAALAWLLVRHPWRAAHDLRRRPRGAPSLRALAPAAFRLSRVRGARLHALGGEDVQLTARRLAALIGRSVDPA